MTHVLVVDDDQTGLDVLEELLNVIGVTTTTVQDASSLPEVVPILAKVDIVFLDLEMPQDGYETLRLLKDTLAVDAPVIAYSVHISEIESAQASGFDGFLGKPIDIDRFPTQFNDILAGLQVWDTN